MPDFSNRDDATNRPKLWKQLHSNSDQECNQRIRALLEQSNNTILDVLKDPNLSRAASTRKPPRALRLQGLYWWGLRGLNPGPNDYESFAILVLADAIPPKQGAETLIYSHFENCQYPIGTQSGTERIVYI